MTRLTDLDPHQQSLIDPRDREALGLSAEVPVSPRVTILRRPKTERDEQGTFANWLLLNELPYCWHSTHRRSTANKGVSDFWVGKNGKSIWLEFKSSPVRLSVEQVAFQERLSQQSLTWCVVFNAKEAIQIIKNL